MSHPEELTPNCVTSWGTNTQQSHPECHTEHCHILRSYTPDIVLYPKELTPNMVSHPEPHTQQCHILRSYTPDTVSHPVELHTRQCHILRNYTPDTALYLKELHTWHTVTSWGTNTQHSFTSWTPQWSVSYPKELDTPDIVSQPDEHPTLSYPKVLDTPDTVSHPEELIPTSVTS